MKQITAKDKLKDSILLLEKKQSDELFLLKEQFNSTCQSLNPIHILKGAVQDITISQSVKDSLINTTAGITVGYISKRIFQGASTNPFKKMAGSVLMFGVTKLIETHPKEVKNMAKGIISVLHYLKPKHIE